MSIHQEIARVDPDISAAAEHDVPVLISGGFDGQRELLARRLHRRGRRAQEPFTKVNCRRPQSVNTALANRLHGVVFLDNIDALSARQQSLVCRLLEAGKTCRVIAGSSTELVSPLRRLAFSSTLFYRLNLVHVTLPSAATPFSSR